MAPIADQTIQPRSTIEGWIWCGVAGHFIGSAKCRMHLHTRVGNFRISTVGLYFPDPHQAKPTPVGLGRVCETMVFRVAGFGQHGEGDVTAWDEIDCEGYADEVAAERGHMRLCLMYDQIARQAAKEGQF